MKPEEALSQIAYMRELVAESRLRAAGMWAHFLLWGVLWVLGYLGTLWGPGWVWLAVYGVGAMLSVAIGGRRQPVPALLRNLGRMTLTLLAGGFGIVLLFGSTWDRHTVNGFYPFIVGLVYLVNGYFMDRALVYIGGWLVLAGSASVFLPSPAQDLFLAAAGGGSLILTGLLLRRQVRGR